MGDSSLPFCLDQMSRNRAAKKVHLLSTEAKAFKVALCKSFGNLANAWLAIVNNDDELQYHEFRGACCRVEFYGGVRRLFAELAQGQTYVKPEAFGPKVPTELVMRREKYSHVNLT